MTLGKPAGEVVVKSLAGGAGTVQRVEIVGTAGALAFRQEADGLHVTIPDGASHDYGIALKISGDRLTCIFIETQRGSSCGKSFWAARWP